MADKEHVDIDIVPDSLEILDEAVGLGMTETPLTEEVTKRLDNYVRAEIVTLRQTEFELLGWAHYDLERVRSGEDYGSKRVFRKKHCAECQPVYLKTTLDDLLRGLVP